MECSSVSTKIFSDAAKTKLPVDGSFELTEDCVFSCRMCYIHNCERRALKSNDRGADKWIRLIDECLDAGLLFALLTGGEPMLHPGFDSVYTRLRENGIITTVNTNAYLITDERLALFGRLPPQRFNISLYGVNDSGYEYLTGAKNGFTVVDRNIRALKDLGCNIRLNLTVCKSNAAYFRDIVAYSKEAGLQLRPTTYLFGTAENCIAQRLDAGEAAKTSVEIFRLTHSEDDFKKMCASMYIKQTAARNMPAFPDDTPGMTCRGGVTSFWVHNDGRMGMCGMIPKDGQPDAFETGFAYAWEQAKKAAAEVESCKECNACEYRLNCKKCHAMLACEDIPDEKSGDSYACAYYKALTDEFIKAGNFK